MAETLGDGYYDIPAGKLAAIVTHLEMTGGPKAAPFPFPGNVSLRPVQKPGLAWYRDLFTRVGHEDWLWTSRLLLDDTSLSEILDDPDVLIWAVSNDGVDHGLLELDFRQKGECELAFFGLTRTLVGSGVGRALMATAQDQAWSRPIKRFHVHTCSLDHPKALGFYIKNGFTPIRQQVEIFDDPRLGGDLSSTAAPQIPIIKPA